VGAPPFAFSTSIAGSRAATEQVRVQLGQVVQALTNILVTLQQGQKAQQRDNQKSK
jgi:hypothetical protein